MYEKQTVVDRIEVLADQTVAVRYVAFADSVTGNYFRPGDDYSAEDSKVQDVCVAVHTPEVIAAYLAPKELS